MTLSSSPALDMVLVGLAGIVVWLLIPRRFVNARLLIQIGFFLAMSAMLLGRHVVPYEPPEGDQTNSGAILIGSAKLLWWLHLAWALIGFVRIYLVFERTPREARLQKSFAPLLLDRPEMTEDLAAILATGTSSPVEGGTPGQQHATSKLALLKAIQTAFRTGPFKRP